MDMESREDIEGINDRQRSPDFPIVGIGASAGGLAALQLFFTNMPADCGMAFVVILHLSPKHESNAAAILQRSTSMPAIQVQNQIALRMNHIYVIPHAHDLIMEDGHLTLLNRSDVRRRPRTIDIFFRTLAQTHRDRAICVVLSGMGSDGAVGLTRIKEEGGVTLAQTPEDAEYEGMPSAAIATGHVDIVLPVVELPQRLLDLWKNAQAISLPPGNKSLHTQPPPDLTAAAKSEEALNGILALLRQRTRHDFHHYKRATVLRRLERRLQVRGLPDLAAYHDYLSKHVEETPLLLQDMLISVTNFFRDRESFEAFEREIIPKLFAGRSPSEPIRVWVVGCASGEEAYSVAILLREQLERHSEPLEIQLFATDIDERAITKARAGIYPSAIVTDLTPTRLRNFFVKERDSYRIAKVVRESILFAAHNVMSDPPFSRVDLICCRNLLIYLDREAQKTVLETFHFALKPEGYLFLGTSETDDSKPGLFEVLDKKNRLYRTITHVGAVRHFPKLMSQLFDASAKVEPADRMERRQPSFAQWHQGALEEFSAPSILLDSDYNILHLTASATPFLEHQGGTPSHNLLSNIHSDLRFELRTALFKATQLGNNIDTPAVPMRLGNTTRSVSMALRNYRDPATLRELLLVIFFDVADGTEPVLVGAPDPGAEFVVSQLENEIDRYKRDLQDTIERSEISTEELKASNEELQAINEELRSATEELETSKEELQSMNEELIALNYELKIKIDETDISNDYLNNLIASTDIATVFVDRDMRVVRFTPRATDIFKLIPSDVGRPLLDVRHQLDYNELIDDVTEAFDSLRNVERKIHGGDKHYLARILPYRTREDKIEGTVLTFIDISALHYAEEKARVGEERLRRAAESIKDYAIITLDEAGLIATWNAGAERAFGYAEAEVLGKSIEIIFTPEDREKGAPLDEMQRARTTGKADDERWHLRKNGTTFYCSGVLSLVDNETTKGFVKIARDITGDKRLEAEREAQLIHEKVERQRMQFVNKMKDEFLAVMSHELKHPLNLIHVNAELLAHMPEVRQLPAVARAAETIRRTVLSQAKIIDDLLDLSRARTGKLTLKLIPSELDSLLSAIVQAAKENAANKQISIDFVCDDASLVAVCDPVRVEQILWNLLSNAIKFTPSGGTISVRLARDNGFAKLIVTDSGEGIAADELANVFDMFNQGHRPHASQQGMGIGLALVRELTLAQGGNVLAESKGIGTGATFTVGLPLSQQTPDDYMRPDGFSSLDGLRILLVDDSVDSSEPFSKLLNMLGAKVATAASGNDALQHLQQQPFDLLISDIGMPDMNGYELIKQVRAIPALAHLAAIALTGYGRNEDKERALQEGFNAHLPKPASLEDIKGTIAKIARPISDNN